MEIDAKDTAVVITDRQNDFLSEKGATWQMVGDSVKENKIIENTEKLIRLRRNRDTRFLSHRIVTIRQMVGGSLVVLWRI